MPVYDKATQAAIDRFNDETGSSHDLAAIRDDARFQAIQEEENSRVVSENTKSPFATKPCPNPVKKANPNCRVESLEILKGKGPRNLIVTEKNNGAVLEIVCGNLETLQQYVGGLVNVNPGKISVTPGRRVVKGPCSTSGTHQNKTFDVPLLNNIITKTDDELKFECFSDWAFFPWNAQPQKYPIRYNTCTTSLRAEVHAYPDVEFGYGFEYKYQREWGSKFNESKNLLTPADHAAKSKFDAAVANVGAHENVFYAKRSGVRQEKLRKQANKKIRKSEKEIAELLNQPSELGWQQSSVQKIKITNATSIFGYYKFAGQELELKKVLKTAIEKAETISGLVKKIESIVLKIQQLEEENKADAEALAEDKFKDAKNGLSFTYPTLGMKTSGLWEEIDGSTECQYGMALAFYAKPLIGVEFKYDITYAVLRVFLAPIGGSVAVLKKKMEDLDISALAVVISVAGKLNIESRMELNLATSFNNLGCSAQMEITMKLEVKVVQFRKRIWKCVVTVDIGASGESGLVFTYKLIPGKFSIDLEWTGIKASVISNTTITKSTETKGAPPKVPSYKEVKTKQDGADRKDTEEHEKTFKIKGQKYHDAYTYNF